MYRLEHQHPCSHAISTPMHARHATRVRAAADTDADGELDCDDGCPTDPAKTEPGADGCLIPPNACKGSFGFVIDSSDSFGQANFDAAAAQVCTRPQPSVPCAPSSDRG